MPSFRIVVDNYCERKIEAAWGLSIFLETPEKNILLDTGPSPSILENNLKELGISPRSIDCVVLTHAHLDHFAGLRYLAENSPGIDVYVPEPSAELLKKKFRNAELNIIGIKESEKICRDVFIIGPMYGPPFEQSLALKTENGIAVFVGCSHPKVINLVAKATKELGGKLHSVVGGFHMGGSPSTECRETIKHLLRLGAEKLMPIHCSGEYIRLILKKQLREAWISQEEGEKITLPIK